MWKKFLCVLLSATLLFSMTPTAAFAEDTKVDESTVSQSSEKSIEKTDTEEVSDITTKEELPSDNEVSDIAKIEAATATLQSDDSEVEGKYTLVSASVNESTSGVLQVGQTLTPKAYVQGKYSATAAPADAKLEFHWYAKGDSDAEWAEITESVDTETHVLTIPESCVGKQIKLTAYALDNTVEWVSPGKTLAAGVFNLMSIATSPSTTSSSTQLITGDTVKVSTLNAKRIDEKYGVNIVSKISAAAIVWYAADSADGEYTKIDGATGAEIVLPKSTANKYIKVVATSGDTQVEAKFGKAVFDANTLDALVQRMKSKSYQPKLAYGTDTNLKTKVEGDIAETYGYENVSVKVKSVTWSADDAQAERGISVADDATNGDITYFYIDPNATTVSYIPNLYTASVTYVFSRDGEEIEYTPSSKVQIPWNEEKAQALLDTAIPDVAIQYATGDGPSAVTQNLTLPLKAGSAQKFGITWATTDVNRVSLPNYQSGTTATGTVDRLSEDSIVTLTATMKIASYGPANVTATKTFNVTVKGDASGVLEKTAALQQKVNAGFVGENIKYSPSGEVCDINSLTDDITLPDITAYGLTKNDYDISYSSESGAIEVSDLAATVNRPNVGSDASQNKLTVTVSYKKNPAIKATKTLDATIAPLTQTEINDELSLMETAKTRFAESILDGQDQNAVTGNLSTFLKVYSNAGEVTWGRKATEVNTVSGISPVDLPGYDANYATTWKTFKSTNSSVVAHETLRVTQPTYNTKVTIQARLSSDKYARYAALYPENADFAKLSDQDVEAQITVKGTTDEESTTVQPTIGVFGVDADGNQENWAASEVVEVERGTTVAELSEKFFAAKGIKADYDPNTAYGWYLNAITSPFDSTLTLSYNPATGKYWQLFVNGKASAVGASSVLLETGDTVQWVYSAYGEEAPHKVVKATMSILGLDAEGKPEYWAYNKSYDMPEGSTGADLTLKVCEETGIQIHYTTSGYGWYVTGMTNKNGVYVGYPPTGFDGNYWTLYLNGAYANVGISGIKLDSGTQVSWVWSQTAGKDVEIPDDDDTPDDEIVVDPEAERPNWTSEWAGYTNGGSATTTASTPSAYAKTSWTFDYAKYAGASWANCSEPVLAGDFVYIAVNNKLLKIDKATGKVLKEAKLRSNVGYTSRPVYTNGLVVVPLNGGQVQALTADELVTTWMSDTVFTDLTQVSSTITVDGNYIYVGTVDVNYPSTFNNGYLTKINIITGATSWQIHDENDGYYWNGATVKGDYLLISTQGGNVRTINRSTGEIVSEKALNSTVNTDCVLSEDGKTAYVMARNGRLFVLSISDDGQITKATTKNIGLTGSTCTPTVSGGKMFVGGEISGGSALAIVDLSNFSTQLIKSAGGQSLAGGGIKGVPLVSTTSAGTFVYFTVNSAETTDWVNYTAGGGVYSYKLGDDEAKLIYDAAGHNQYCDSPVICDDDGNLYYINDSGTLFKLEGTDKKPDKNDDSDKKDNSNKGSDNSNSNSNASKKHHSSSKENKHSKKSKDSKTHQAKMNNGKDKGDKKDKDKDKKDESKTTQLANSKDQKTTATKGADNREEENLEQPFKWLPIAGITIGVLMICGAGCFLLRQKKGVSHNG